MILAVSVTAIAAIVGVAGNALTLLTTNEYTKLTMRGGKDVTIEGDKQPLQKQKAWIPVMPFNTAWERQRQPLS
ncbi:MAG: hypothetical protein IPI68_04970 [Chitinophagaceae bacterium]|nr:hypothetical protein [Chitinophagaceae bacterium]